MAEAAEHDQTVFLRGDGTAMAGAAPFDALQLADEPEVALGQEWRPFAHLVTPRPRWVRRDGLPYP